MAFLGLSLGVVLAPSIAFAHGDEIEISITPLRPDPERPLLRLYRVHVTFEFDGEPVAGATVTLTARRDPQGDLLEPHTLTELEGIEGVYAGEVEYSRFGTWVVDVKVSAEFGQGEGEASFTDDVSLANRSAAEEAQLANEAARVIRLQAFFGFDAWPDLVNIVMRAAHSLAGVTYFAASGAALLFAWTGTEVPSTAFSRLARWFGPMALVSLALLLAAGIYEMFFDGPVVAPGIFDLSAMRRLPYGEWYLAAFALKPALFLAIVVLARRIRNELRAADPTRNASEAARGAAMSALRRDAALNAAAGGTVVIVVATVIYLHYVSHLGVLLPE